MPLDRSGQPAELERYWGGEVSTESVWCIALVRDAL